MKSSRNLIALLCVLVSAASGCATQEAGPAALAMQEESGALPDPAGIELDRVVHFSDLQGNPVLLDAGSYRVEKNDESTLTLIGVDGESDLIAAMVGEHDETLSTPAALSVTAGEDEHHIVLLEPDGTTLDAAGSYSGVAPRAARRMARARLGTAQISTAYRRSSRTLYRRKQTVERRIPPKTNFNVWNLSQFDVNQVWLVRYEEVPGQDVGNKIATLLTTDLSHAVPCGSTVPGAHYNDRISVRVPVLNDASGQPKTTPYYLFEYIQERLCSPQGIHLYWGDLSAPNAGGYVLPENAVPIPSKAFAPGIVDFRTRDGSDYPNQSAYRLVRETMFIFDLDGYPRTHTRHEQALCGPDGKVYLYRKPYPTYFVEHPEYESGPIPLAVLGSYVWGYYDDIDCSSQ